MKTSLVGNYTIYEVSSPKLRIKERESTDTIVNKLNHLGALSGCGPEMHDAILTIIYTGKYKTFSFEKAKAIQRVVEELCSLEQSNLQAHIPRLRK